MLETKISLLRLYAILIAYRILNAFLIQTQFDPDEYWQTLEPSYCIVFSPYKYNCAYTWEWTRRYKQLEQCHFSNCSASLWERIIYGPIRSHVSLLPTILIYSLARYVHLDSNFIISKGPALLNAVVVAAPTDLAIYFIATKVFRRTSFAWWALFTSVTSWFHAYALVRTYSNSMECMMITLGIALLATDLFTNSSVRRTCIPAVLAFFLGGISVSIRFTAITAWIPMGLIYCWKKNTWKETVWNLLFVCALSGLCGILFCSLIDYYFYGFWTIPFLASIHFNVLLNLGSLYGVHPWHWYFTSGLPAISGLMLPFFFFAIYGSTCFYIRKITHSSPVHVNRKTSSQQETFAMEQDEEHTNVMYFFLILIFYVAIHSISPHKEFRFILPILPIVCIISGKVLHELVSRHGRIIEIKENTKPSQYAYRRNKWRIYILFFLLNFPHLLYLLTIHQAAPISVNKAIVQLIETQEKNIKEMRGFESFKDSKTLSKERSHFSIHYLMGCHSTPVYSHLHISSVTIDTWTLDCSPQCRADVNVLCESDRFHEDPLTFMKTSYKNALDADVIKKGSKVSNDWLNSDYGEKSLPDFMVLFKSEAEKVMPMLNQLDFVEIKRFPHALTNISFRKAFDFVYLEYDYMILYSKGNKYRGNE